jgi:gliding motility-associated-like protein
MKNFTKLLLAAVCLMVFQFIGISQTDNHHLHKDANGGNIDKFYLPLEYDVDSLVGFDEEAAWDQAKMNYSEEWMQKRFVAVLKRNYIDFHYGYQVAKESDPTVQAPCTNPGFETGTLAGWTALEGSNTNSQTMAGCCAAATTQAVIVGPGNDPNVGAAVPMVPPGGGNFAVRLGQTGTGGISYRLNQTFTVTAANSVFIYKYAVILQDGTHSCAEQPFFNIKFETCNNVVIPCAQYQASAAGSGCPATSGADPSFIASGAWLYKPWQTRSFDLSAYIGQCVNIEFTVGGCVASQGAHPGYAYIDASCEPMTLELNGVDIPVGQTNTAFCAVGNNTLCAPPGFTSYSWNGPGVTGQTSQCVNAAAVGSYSVTLGMQGTSCQSPVLFSNFVLTPKPTANFNFTTTACQSTFTVPFADASTLNGGPALTNWTWDFNNDGVPDNITQNPTNTFPAQGTYSVELKVSNGGCTDSITQVVNVSPTVVASFTNSSGCLNTATNFTATSTPSTGITSHVWDFGDGGAGTGATLSHTYTTSGPKVVTYTVTNSAGCTSVNTQTINVFPNPVMAITANTVCLNVPTTFVNTSSVSAPATISAWAWDFENNGSVDNSTQTPTNTYTTLGTFVAVLTATTNNGCINTTSVNVKVNPLPTATFTPVNACMNTNVLLNNGSIVPLPDNISSYVWNFGTGAAPTTTSSVQNPPTLTYNSSGIKTITLTITANTTCSASITQTVTVYPQPVANFSTTSVCQGTATAYTDMSTPTGSITAWAWDFTNNGSTDNVSNAPTNTYPTSGTFTTGLIVTDNNTCKDTIKLAVDVWGHTIPNFTPDKVCFGTASVFTNLTDETTNPNVGSGTTYVWDFADTSPTTTIVNPSHTYTLGGNTNATYNVTLTATSLHNCVDVITKPISVYAIPTASFTSDSVCLGSLSHLTDASAGNGNVINAYMWDYLSDGTVDLAGVANPNFVFPAFGNNNVSYTVSTSPVVGLVCSNMTNTIQVWVNPIPQPDFTFVNNCINSQPNTFNGSSSMIAIGTNTSFVWAYGDGAVSTPTSASTSTHTYAAAGVYNATLTLTSNKGCQNIIVKAVEVYEKPKMLITNSTPCDQSVMTFSATQQANSGTVTNWYWDFNNSITSVEGTGQNTSFTFAGPGDYTIHLVSETNHGCRDTIQQFVYVNYIPQPDFTVNDPDGCPKHCVTFTDMTPAIPGPASLANWTWTLGDGSNPISNTSNATVAHCYVNNSSSQLAQYSVQLMVTTSAGCTVAVTKSNYITVFPKPIAQYVANPNPSNVLEPLVYFTNQSIDYTKWWWMFGDGSPLDSVNVDPEHFYSDETAQTYYSVLLVANQYGCLDTAYLPVEIGPEFTFYIPNAFTPSNDDGINDYFNGTGIGIDKYEMWVFDRWGERVFYTDDIKKGWDGRVQGKSKEGKQDIYTWKVKLTDVLGKKHDYIGHVTLLK